MTLPPAPFGVVPTGTEKVARPRVLSQTTDNTNGWGGIVILQA